MAAPLRDQEEPYQSVSNYPKLETGLICSCSCEGLSIRTNMVMSVSDTENVPSLDCNTVDSVESDLRRPILSIVAPNETPLAAIDTNTLSSLDGDFAEPLSSPPKLRSSLMRMPSFQRISINNINHLELDESMNLNGYSTPRYGDGNVESDTKERELIHQSQDKGSSQLVQKFIHDSDESSSPDSQPYPLCRLKYLGRGQSSMVYKSVLVNRLTVCAEKVVTVGNTAKRVQLIRELESLKFSLQHKNTSTDSNAGSNVQDQNLGNYCPYIVNLIDVIPNPRDGTLSVCLEYMDGGSLQTIVAMGGCNQERVLLGIAQQMLMGLAFLHSKRIIHRDLKPSNTLFSSTGMVKLADFGLAKALDEGNSMANSFIGTFDYMSPERLKGDEYGVVSDIWSFGLTIHAVAIGKYPYHAVHGYWSIMNAIQEQEPPTPSAEIFSQEFIDFITLCCMKEPEQRPTASFLLQHPFMLSQNNDVCSPHGSVPISPSKQSDTSRPSTDISSLADISRDKLESSILPDIQSDGVSMVGGKRGNASASALPQISASQTIEQRFRSPNQKIKTQNRSYSNSISEESVIGIAISSPNANRPIRAAQPSIERADGSNGRNYLSPSVEKRSRSGRDVQKRVIEESASFLRQSLTKSDFRRIKSLMGNGSARSTSVNTSNGPSATSTPRYSRSTSRSKVKDASKQPRPGSIHQSQSMAVQAVNSGNNSINKPLKSKVPSTTTNASSKAKGPANSFSETPQLPLLSPITKRSPHPSPRQSQLHPSTSHDSTTLPSLSIKSGISQVSALPVIPLSISTSALNSATASATSSVILCDPNMSGYTTPRNPMPVYHNHVGEFSSSRRQSKSAAISPGDRDGPYIDFSDPSRSPDSDRDEKQNASDILKISNVWKLYITKKLANPNRKARGLAEILEQASADRSHSSKRGSFNYDTSSNRNDASDVWTIDRIDELGMDLLTKERVFQLASRLNLSQSEELYQAFTEAASEVEYLVASGSIIRSKSYGLSPSRMKYLQDSLRDPSDLQVDSATLEFATSFYAKQRSSSSKSSMQKTATTGDWSPIGNSSRGTNSPDNGVRTNRQLSRIKSDELSTSSSTDDGDILDDMPNVTHIDGDSAL